MDKILMEKYELRKILGEGGSSIVYLAWDRHLERFAAVKETKSTGTEADDILKKERELLKSLSHPMLPVLYDFFQEDRQYLVMEYIEGISLHNYIEREGAITEEKACEWALQLLGLLSYLHAGNPPVIYRDLKPDNIIICPDGGLRVVDFGAALFIRYQDPGAEDMAGTIGYAAPEQFGWEGMRDGRADERSDIYTFGATFYHMLTGYNPSFPPCGIRPVRCMNPLLTTAVEQIVEKCTKPEPDRRYQTVEEVRRDLLQRASCKRKRIFRSKERYMIRKLEKRIRLTQKKTVGLLACAIFLFGMAAALFGLTVRGRERPLPVILYNAQGQKVIVRYDSVYETDGSLIIELEPQLFPLEGIQALSVSLTDCGSGEKRERIFYIQRSGIE